MPELAVFSDDIVSKVIEKIKKETSDFSILTAIYVINKEKQLIGVFGLHELLLQNLNVPIYKFMIQNIVVVHLTTPIEIAVKKMFKYRLSSIPVIDFEKHLLGIVTLDDAAKFMLNKLP